MFEGAEGCVYTTAFRRWKELSEENGIHLDTHDLVAPGSADLLWFLDLPRTKSAWRKALGVGHENAISVLQILESPLLFPAAFQPKNRALFDHSISFENTSPESSHFQYRLPVDGNSRREGLEFDERKLAVMVNTNRHEGWLATRKEGLTGLPGIGPCFSGWHLPAGFLFHPAKGELYSWRRSVARHFAASNPADLTIFGEGWNGENVSWTRSCQLKSPCSAKRALGLDSKRLELGNFRFVIAAENFRGNRGYISEKIFDALLGGSVPVYLGDDHIQDSVPPACFVDAREYSNLPALLSALRAMTKEEWEGKRQAGREFLSSEDFTLFAEDAFTRGMMDIVNEISRSVQNRQAS